MCVAITLLGEANLTLEEIVRMDRSNADGVGIAWAYSGHVHWWKTTKVDPEEVFKIMTYWSNLPRLMHFRLSTAGGTRPELCHPFEVGPLAACMPEGVSQRVMIHNGHWHRWKEVHDLLASEDILPDKGPWSYSRLAAFLAHIDPEWFTALGGRVATLDGDETIHRLGDWSELREGIHVSNKHWDTAGGYKRGGYEGYRKWKGWEWTDEDRAAFAKEQKELREAMETPDAPEPEEKASGKKKTKKEYKALGKKGGGKTNGKGRQFSEDAWTSPDTGKTYKYDIHSGDVVEIIVDSEESATCATSANGEVAP